MLIIFIVSVKLQHTETAFKDLNILNLRILFTVYEAVISIIVKLTCTKFEKLFIKFSASLTAAERDSIRTPDGPSVDPHPDHCTPQVYEDQRYITLPIL